MIARQKQSPTNQTEAGKRERDRPLSSVVTDSSARFEPLPAVTRTRFSDQIYNHLFHKIIAGEFKEGDMLPSENDLCALFRVSRPVVRQALQRLRSDGLVVSRRGAGSFVQAWPSLNVSSELVAEKRRILFDNLEIRRVIEPQAAVFAAARRTKRDLAALRAAVDQFEQAAIIDGSVSDHLDFAFHRAVAVATDNPRFVDVIRLVEFDVDVAVNLVRYLTRIDHVERSRAVHAEHARILDAIERKDPDGAGTAMREHLEKARLRLLDSQLGVSSGAGVERQEAKSFLTRQRQGTDRDRA